MPHLVMVRQMKCQVKPQEDFTDSLPPRKIFYTADEAADTLAISRPSLCAMAKAHPLYKPSACGFPGVSQGRSRVAYHHVHLSIIARVRLGVMDPEEGVTRWKLFLAREGE